MNSICGFFSFFFSVHHFGICSTLFYEYFRMLVLIYSTPLNNAHILARFSNSTPPVLNTESDFSKKKKKY